MKQITNEDKSEKFRESIVNVMVKRLTASSIIGDKRKPKKNNKKVWTPEEIEEQRRLFEKISNDEESDY